MLKNLGTVLCAVGQAVVIIGLSFVCLLVGVIVTMVSINQQEIITAASGIVLCVGAVLMMVMLLFMVVSEAIYEIQH